MNLPLDLRFFGPSQIETRGVTLKTGDQRPFSVGGQEARSVAEVETLSDADAPHVIDTHVGARVRMRRKEQGLSQEQLAESLGVTFQQVQKYERGSNRISASRLHQIAQRLKVPVAWFFQGAAQESWEDSGPAELERSVNAFLMTPEGFDIVRRFPRLRPSLRRRVLELVRTLADIDDD
ncbi:MAG: helix-turn-helix transcriptional regulator [Proteobacteria bacterium]|nr:helix-turn-helix transcriptional regulator [Pseudomonadota bacterium]